MNILFLAPHNDDETLYAGATLHKLSKKHNIFVIVLSAFGLEFGKKAAEILGIKHSYMHFLTYENKRDALVNFVKRENIEIVITTHCNDAHKDHREVAKMAREICYWCARKSFTGELAVKQPLLLMGSIQIETIGEIKAEVYSEVSKEDLDAKIMALKNYDIFKNDPMNKVYDIVHDVAWVYREAERIGSMVGVHYAERFEIGNYCPVIDIKSLL